MLEFELGSKIFARACTISTCFQRVFPLDLITFVILFFVLLNGSKGTRCLCRDCSSSILLSNLDRSSCHCVFSFSYCFWNSLLFSSNLVFLSWEDVSSLVNFSICSTFSLTSLLRLRIAAVWSSSFYSMSSCMLFMSLLRPNIFSCTCSKHIVDQKSF